MSCADGKNCDEPLKRRRAVIVFGLMIVIFIVLSGFSFLSSRHQVTPDTVSFGAYQATDGKRVFQAYNCMGCHTLVGNGAYLGPDLTREYASTGPAWLAAFLPSAGGWPTEAAVRTQLANKAIAADAGVDDIEAYYRKFPGAKERIERRGGGNTLMPNLPLDADEIGRMIAFLKYTSAMNTEGWPPEVRVAADRRLALVHGMPVATANAIATQATASASATDDPVARGKQLAAEFACTACHALDASRQVGPGWGGLYGARVSLADGGTATADEAYLVESILQPDAHVVAGYPAGVMPPYSSLLGEDDARAIVAYIRSLETP